MDMPPIVYEDDALIAFDKPSGLLTAPDRWDKTPGSLIDILHAGVSPEYFNVHRLDKETSGLLLFAKSKEWVRMVSAAFESGGVSNLYVALVRGAPREGKGTITVPIATDQNVPGKMVATMSQTGRMCETAYEVVQQWRGYALVHVWPLTGRTHQIRVHLASIGCPIVCDPVYGTLEPIRLSELKPDYKFKSGHDELPLLDRLALHSHQISLMHPLTGQRITLEAPLPKPFAIAIKKLTRWA